MIVFHYECRRNILICTVVLHFIEKIRNQPRGGDEIVAKALPHVVNSVLMIPRVLLIGAVKTMRIVKTENSFTALILQDKRVTEAVRLLFGYIGPICPDDHLPTIFHPANTGHVDQV